MSMMKQLFLLLLLFPAAIMRGQDTPAKPRHFFIGLAVSPDYCFRTLKNNATNEAGDAVISVRNNTEVPKLGTTAGMSFGYRTNSFMLETGIRYSIQGYKTKELMLTREGPNDSPENMGTGRFKYNYHYLEFPLKASILLGKKKLRFIAGGGAAAGLFLFEKKIVQVDSPSRSVSKESNFIYNPFNLYAIASAGIDLKIGERLDLRIEPNFKYGLLQIIDLPVTGYLWSAGLNVGLNFGL
ncbi:MAG: hypothetical protein JWO44_1780 [Bacteroidetes bacterium]|jgi:hypothetical protein|nr:hypothetical protein [Bacteroidota bacterium]